MAFSDYLGAGTNVLSSALGYFSNQDNNNAVRDQANAQLQASQNALQAAQIKAETDLKIAALQLSQKPKQNNTLLYVGLGVGGLLVVGLIAFAVTRK